jgi:hypothetical protein
MESVALALLLAVGFAAQSPAETEVSSEDAEPVVSPEEEATTADEAPDEASDEASDDGADDGATAEPDEETAEEAAEATDPPAAQAPATTADRAETLLDDKRPSEALELIAGALEAGGLDVEAHHALWVLRARSHGLLGQGQQAQQAFAVALRLLPEWRLEGQNDPQVSGPYNAAFAVLPPERRALFARVEVREEEKRRRIAYTLVADDLGVVAGAEAHLDGEKLTDLVLSLDEPEGTWPLDPSSVKGKLELRLVDAWGNALRVLDVPDAPAADAAQASAPAELRWLTLSGGTALAIGAIGVTAAGIWLSAVDSDQVDPPDGAREVALAGVGVATGVIVIGGILVVTDFLLSPP